MLKTFDLLAILSVVFLISCVSNDMTREEWTELQKRCREESRKDMNPLTNNSWEYEECVKEGMGQPRNLGEVRSKVRSE